MIAADASTSLQLAVREYFSGEHSEMIFILAGSVLFASLAVWLWLSTRSGFTIAFMVIVLASAALLSSTAALLLVRDAQLSRSLEKGIGSSQHAVVVSAERARIEAVVSKYRYYRNGTAALAAVSLLGLLLTHRSWVHGAAAGLLLLVVAQVVIDHFSEHRARLYLTCLSAGPTLDPTPTV